MKNNNSSSGLGVMGVLQIIFIVLKCMGLTDFTWVQVFIPTFISLGLAALAIIVIIAIVVIDQIKYHSNDKFY